MSKFSQHRTSYEMIETMQHQQQTYYEKIETMQHLYAHIHPHSTLPLDLSSNFDLGAPRKALINAFVSTNSSFKTMARSNQGACAPDCYGVVPSRVQEMTAEQPPHAGVLSEA